jgi:hypothetical protein
VLGSEFPVRSTVLNIGLHVPCGGLVGGEHFVQKLMVVAARFDAWEQRIERFRDMATETQFQGDAAPQVRGITVDLNDFRLLRNEIDVGKIRSQHDQNVASFESFL